jgi:hypothetical protein
VNSKSLTPEQIARIQWSVGRMQHYLAKLSGRCQQKYFPADDPLKVAAEHAREAVNNLDAAIKNIGIAICRLNQPFRHCHAVPYSLGSIAAIS